MSRPRSHLAVGCRACLLVVATLVGCGDPAASTGAGSASPAASPVASAPASAPADALATAAPSASTSRPPWEAADIPPPVERDGDASVGGWAAHTVALAMVDDAVIRANPELVAKHFGPDIAFPLAVQRVAVHGKREAVLIASSNADVAPMVILADETGRALWTKERPLAGTREKVRGLSLIAGPEGSVVIAWWDEPTRAVALRRWGFDGSVFADYHLFDADSCEALDAIYWPTRGWIVTVTTKGSAHAVLLTETGLGGLGGGVVEVTSSERVLSRAAAAAGIDGIFHAYMGLSIEASPASQRPSLYVTLRRADGSSAWKAPVQISAGRTDGKPSEPVVSLETPAVLRVTVGEQVYRIGSDGRRVEKVDRAPDRARSSPPSPLPRTSGI